MNESGEYAVHSAVESGNPAHVRPARPGPGAPTPIRVLIADDHPLLRFGVRALLASHADMEIAGEAATGQEAVALCVAHQPDIVLMDLQMPVMSGFDALAEIARVAPACRVVVLTTFAGDAQVVRALKAGARGYLLKTELRTALVDAIRDAAGGDKPLSPRAAASLAHHFDSRELAPREVDVLRLVAEGQSNKRIAQQLGITAETVKCHLKSIFVKLGAHDRAHAAAIALRRGILDQ